MVLKKFTWPAELTLTLIGGKWKGLILNHLLTGESKRFGELKRLSAGISAKILAKHLKELEFDGLITRMVVGTDKPRIVYAPTSRSRTLAPVLFAIQQWGEEHWGLWTRTATGLRGQARLYSGRQPHTSGVSGGSASRGDRTAPRRSIGRGQQFLKRTLRERGQGTHLITLPLEGVFQAFAVQVLLEA